uniref:Ankyrin repeat-containing protein n=1 Tax=Noccaea caerulescens TaxID=107243 RepID=A0A1J3G0Q4_NOCCA
MESKLLLVTESGSVDALYSLIKEDPCILQKVDDLPLIHTPLHEASSTGKMDLAMELMVLKPSFAKKLNEDGFSPLHLAVENQQAELALELVKFDPSLVRIRGRGGMTALHLVAKKGDVDLLTEFLRACPESIRDANANGETALHIAVMNKKYEELQVLTGWMQRGRKSEDGYTENHVLNRGDRKGNTALHLAAYKNDRKGVKQLLKCMSLNRNIKNKSGMTALDALRANGSHMNKATEIIIKISGGKTGESLSKVEKMSVFLRKPVTFCEYCSTGIARYRSRMSDGARNALLVITALIITATYQTASQPVDKDKLEKLDLGEILLDVMCLWGFNTTAFLLSIVLTFLLLPAGRAYTWWYIFIAVPLVCSFWTMTYMKYHPSIFFDMYMLVALGFIIYVIVFYVRWKCIRQKKVQKPKTELISERNKTMVV